MTSEGETSSQCHSGRRPSPLQLPPCRVCQDRASGFHYGVNSCEACKVFYRRTLKRVYEYKCIKEGNCVIQSGRRINCSYCRLKKCIRVGMSKDGIRRGRYTVEQRLDCIREVKYMTNKTSAPEPNLISKEKNSNLNSRHNSASGTFSESEDDVAVHSLSRNVVQQQGSNAITANIENQHRHRHNTLYGSNQQVPTSTSQESIGWNDNPGTWNENTASKKLEEHSVLGFEHISLRSENREESIYHTSQIYHDGRGYEQCADVDMEKEQLIATLTWASNAHNVYGEELLASLPRIHKQFKDYKISQEFKLEEVKGLNQNEYHELFERTGIDIDGRRQMALSHNSTFGQRVTKFVNFTKCLPGFSSLSMNDKIILVKNSLYDWWGLCAYVAVNDAEKLFTCACGYTWNVEELGKINDDEFITALFMMGKVLHNLKLGEQERALLQAIVVMSTDGCGGLEDVKKVETIQERFVETLQYYLHRWRPDEPSIMAQILATGLVIVRTCAQAQEVSAQRMLRRWPDLDYPQMLLELLTE